MFIVSEEETGTVDSNAGGSPLFTYAHYQFTVI